MGPEFEKVAHRLEPKARFLKLNSDNEQQLASSLGIRGIPTMILFKDGKPADRVSGAMQASQISTWLSERIA
ncbi:Thioredoxin-2 [compost metagenome]